MQTPPPFLDLSFPIRSYNHSGESYYLLYCIWIKTSLIESIRLINLFGIEHLISSIVYVVAANYNSIFYSKYIYSSYFAFEMSDSMLPIKGSKI